jgi:hypothetical protein
MLSPDGNKARELEKSVLNDHILRSEKHYEELKTIPITNTLWDRPVNHAFVYTLYGDEMYLTYLRYSIMSLRLVAPDCKIIVFAEAKIWARAKQELKHLMFEYDIIYVNGTAACYKQVIACHRLLKDYKQATFLDADLFFLGKKGSLTRPLSIIKHMINNDPESFVWAFSRQEKPNVSHTFMHKRGRSKTLHPHTYAWDIEEELGMELQDLLETDTIWNISYIFTFSPRAIQTDAYKAWALYTLLDNNHCDESCWYLWGKKHKWKNYSWYRDVKEYVSISSTTHQSEKDLHLFQPMFTDTLETKTHRKQETFMAILEIENKYREYIKDDRIQQR